MAASYLAAPRLTEEEEEREKASLTDAERIAALCDLYGTLPIPTPELDGLNDPDAASELLAASHPRRRSGITSFCCLPPDESKENLAHGLEELERVLVDALDAAFRDDTGFAELIPYTATADADSVDNTDNGAASEPPQQPEMVRVSTAEYRQALERCPNIVKDPNHRLLFLRAEIYDAQAAAIRLLRYWTDRIAVFGEEHAFEPLFDHALTSTDIYGDDGNDNDNDVTDTDQYGTTSHATCTGNGEHKEIPSGPYFGDSTELKMGYPRMSPEKDASGRALIIFNQSLIERKIPYNRTALLRACWLRVHRAVLQDEQVQRSGLVLIGLGYGQLDQLDRKLDVLLWRSIRDVLPARIVASHFVYGSNHLTYSMIAPNIKFYFGRTARARLREHFGSESLVREQLEKYGISRSSLPVEIGGGWSYNDMWFLKKRVDVE